MKVKELQPYWGKNVKIICANGDELFGRFSYYTPDDYDSKTDTEKPGIALESSKGIYGLFVEEIVSIELL